MQQEKSETFSHDTRIEELLRATKGERYTTQRWSASPEAFVSRLTTAGIFITGVVLLGFFSVAVFYAQYSGILRWILLLLLLCFMALILMSFSTRGYRDPPPLEMERKKEKPTQGDLKKMATTFERAGKRMLYSRLVVMDRIREAFWEKFRLTRNLTHEDAERLKGNQEELKKIIRDEEILGFLVESEKESKQWSKMLREKKPAMESFSEGGEFIERVFSLIEKMEAWE